MLAVIMPEKKPQRGCLPGSSQLCLRLRLERLMGLEAGSNFDLRCPTLMAAININVNHTLSTLRSALFN